MLLQKMRNREPCPQCRAMTTVECEQFLDRPITQHALHPAFYISPDPGRSEPLAFKTEKGDFVERVDHAKPRIELEAIDDPDFVPEPDMFWTQIAMAVDDATPTHARGNEIAAPIQEQALGPIDAADKARLDAEARIEQDAPIIGEAALPVGKMDGRRDKDGRGRAIKSREGGDQPVELRNLDTPLADHKFEHVALVEALHADEPVDHGSGTADRQASTGIHQRQDVKVDIRRKCAIELQLGAAGGLPPRQSRKVEIGKANRLLELVNPVANQKDP
ncbi:MAG: hypothetical protein PSV22_04385 [Pseudolabrys sp.]|nr:hypothetical protein [Pseudolabrys sp.]